MEADAIGRSKLLEAKEEKTRLMFLSWEWQIFRAYW